MYALLVLQSGRSVTAKLYRGANRCHVVNGFNPAAGLWFLVISRAVSVLMTLPPARKNSPRNAAESGWIHSARAGIWRRQGVREFADVRSAPSAIPAPR